jgi:hypothetical protein
VGVVEALSHFVKMPPDLREFFPQFGIVVLQALQLAGDKGQVEKIVARLRSGRTAGSEVRHHLAASASAPAFDASGGSKIWHDWAP